TVERLTRAPVVERDLACGVEARELEHLIDVGLACAVEYRRCHRHALPQLLAQRDKLLVRQLADLVIRPIDLRDRLLEPIELAALAVLLQSLINDAPEATAGPAEVRLKDLPDVHT